MRACFSDGPMGVKSDSGSSNYERLIEAEQENRIADPLGLTPNLPFGHLNAAWGKFLANFGLEAENELWFFQVPKDSSTGEYDMFDGPISGYAKVVNGKVMGEFMIEASE